MTSASSTLLQSCYTGPGL